MADFVFFTVTGMFKVLQSDMTDAGGDPDFGTITGLVTFTPQLSVIESRTLTPMTTVLMQPIVGRIEEDGKLKTLDSAPLYYVDGDTRNACPTGKIPVFVDGDPAYWRDEEGNHYDNPAGTPVYGVRLVANSAAIGATTLTYKVDFSKVVYDHSSRTIPSFYFPAPTSDVEVDMVNLASGS